MSEDRIKKLEMQLSSEKALRQSLEETVSIHSQRQNDHIKKLEAALTHIYTWYPISVSEPIKTIHEIRDYARKVLEEKDG